MELFFACSLVFSPQTFAEWRYLLAQSKKVAVQSKIVPNQSKIPVKNPFSTVKNRGDILIGWMPVKKRWIQSGQKIILYFISNIKS